MSKREREFRSRQHPSIITAFNDEEVFLPWYRGASWDNWKTVLKALFGEPLGKAETKVFEEIAGGRKPSRKRARQGWFVVGRRGGKDSVIAGLATFLAAIEESHVGKLRPGEVATVACIAADRDQAGIVFGYIRAFFGKIPELAEKVVRQTARSILLDNGAEIVVATNSFRATRGRTFLAVILDECAFYRDENSANPDLEVFRALEPGLATLAPYSMIVGISSPYRKSGLLYEKYTKHFGKDSDKALVIQAPSRTMNPDLGAEIVADALEADYESASAEWLGQFRNDISGYLTREVIEACVESGRTVRPPQDELRYVAFVDVASGTGRDSFVTAIGHTDRDGTVVLDCILEQTPPFSSTGAIGASADLLKEYRVSTVVGDRYAPGFVAEAYARNNIHYNYSEKDRSQLYVECLPLLTSGRVQLLDNPKLIAQFCGLERRTSSGGKDTIDHGRERHDDMANATAGLMGLTGRISILDISAEMSAEIRAIGPSPYALRRRKWSRKSKVRAQNRMLTDAEL